jgi:hypothetical protein
MGQPQVPQSVEPMGMPQGQPIDPSQIPPEMLAQMPAAQQGAPIMAMGGHVYMCGGRRYDFGGWVDENNDTLKGAGAGAATGAATGAGIGSFFAPATAGLSTIIGAGAGALIGGIAGGIKGHKKDKAEKDQAAAEKAAQDAIPTPEEIAAKQREETLAGLNLQYGTAPMGYNQIANTNAVPGQVMAGGGHMYYGNPFFSSKLYKPNYTSQAENLMGNPWNYNNGLEEGFNFTSQGGEGNKSVYDTSLDNVDNEQNFTGSALTGLGALGSMAYNAYMGFGKKPKTYTESDFYTKPQLKELQPLAFNPLSLERVNYTPAVQAAERNAAGAMKGLREAGDAGSYLNNLATVQNVYGDAAKNIEMTQANANTDIANKEKSYNTQAKQETAKYNTGLNQYYNNMLLSLAEQDARAKQLATEANWRTQASRQGSQQQVFSDIYGLGKTQDANTLASMYANIQAPPGEGVNYQSWLQSLFNLGKG